MSTDIIDLKAKLIADFSVQETLINGKSESVFCQTRKKAIRQFEKLGFPSAKHEEWKYSNVKNLIGADYNFNGQHQVTPELADEIQIPGLDGNILYFINGKYEAALSRIVSPASEVTILPLHEAITAEAELFNKYFNTIAKTEDEAFADQGVFIHVGRSKEVSQPIVLCYISDARQHNVGQQPRNLVIIEENAHVKVAETFKTIGPERSFTNIVSEIFVAKDAYAEFYKVQDESQNAYHVGTTQVQMLDRSHFYSATVTVNGGFIRNNLHIEIDGEYCDAYMYGLYVPDGVQHIDNHTLADHRKPNSISNELYKGVLRDQSKGVFNGKIFVRQDAQKTNAYQSCKNVVLSDGASMNTKPQLEIFADDVKCSHGTTTGQLDDEALFYLRSRGIPKSEAMRLLMFAFCEDVLTQIRIDSIKEHLEALVSDKLSN
jgi:Fe-S cluster assembly protein SufD